MNKNGDTITTEEKNAAVQVPLEEQKPQDPVRFDRSFTDKATEYVIACGKANKKPTVKEFANSIGVDQHTIWAWAGKRKKDEQGNVTEELARPKFHVAITQIDKLERAEEKLTPQQELFCQLYASSKEFFGNGVQSYIEAYGTDITKPGAYNTAKAGAYENLTKPYLLKRIDKLLELGGLNNQFVDKQLQFVIAQNGDLSSKIAAIREYNKVYERVIERVDHTTKGKEIKQVVGFTVIAPTEENGTDKPDNQANA